MYKQSRPVRVGMIIKSDLLEQMKSYLKQVNDDKSLKYVSQSEFVNEAIKQLLNKELNKEFKYKGPDVLDSGNTELFTIDVLAMEK